MSKLFNAQIKTVLGVSVFKGPQESDDPERRRIYQSCAEIAAGVFKDLNQLTSVTELEVSQMEILAISYLSSALRSKSLEANPFAERATIEGLFRTKLAFGIFYVYVTKLFSPLVYGGDIKNYLKILLTPESVISDEAVATGIKVLSESNDVANLWNTKYSKDRKEREKSFRQQYNWGQVLYSDIPPPKEMRLSPVDAITFEDELEEYKKNLRLLKKERRKRKELMGKSNLLTKTANRILRRGQDVPGDPHSEQAVQEEIKQTDEKAKSMEELKTKNLEHKQYLQKYLDTLKNINEKGKGMGLGVLK